MIKINIKYYLIRFKFIFIFIYLLLYSYINIKKHESNKCIEKFLDILPSTYPKSNNKNLKSVFESRILYINNSNITNEYIRCLRPLKLFLRNKNSKLRKKYIRQKISQYYFRRRKDQFSFEEYSKQCIKEKLINQNKIKTYKISKTPFISIIIALYNKEKELLKSIRSIQNQSLKNIEIIIVNDASNDNSEKILAYLLKTDPRIRVFNHITNLGLWRTRIDGLLYSNGKYVIHFDSGDFYYDNYVLEDLYNLIEKYKLDSVKSIFRIINTYNYSEFTYCINEFKDMKSSYFLFDDELKNLNVANLLNGVVWNRLILSSIYINGLYILSDRVLNIYKNLWEDRYWNKFANRMSNNLLIVKRYGYLYYYDGKGAGTVKLKTKKEKDKSIKEFINFLYFDYDLLPKKDNKTSIIKTLFDYDQINKEIKLDYLQTDFHILIDLINLLINDPYVNIKNKIYLKQLLKDILERQNKIKRNKNFN